MIIFIKYCRWWVNWRDPIFKEDRARNADDFENGKVLRRTESEPELAFNYSKLTGEIDGEDGDGFVQNGNINKTATTRAGTTTSRKTATAASRGGAKSGY